MSVELTFVTRADCHLCIEADATVTQVLAGRSVTRRDVDVDSDPELQAKYDWEVPVVLINGRQHSFHRVDAARLAAALDRAQAQ